MRVLVVVESLFGNTYQIAEAVADGISSVHPSVTTSLVRVGDVEDVDLREVDLLVVGSPTHWRGMPSDRTERQYLRDGDRIAGVTRIGSPIDPSRLRVRDWLTTLPTVKTGRAAAFDTRLARPFAGGAAPRLARRLARLGYEVTGEPTGFIVTGMEGPLREGESDRARVWGHDLLGPLLA